MSTERRNPLEPIDEIPEILARRPRSRTGRDRGWDANRTKATYDLPEGLIRRIHEIVDDLTEQQRGAKIRVSEAATEGASIGHQVHGAIGFTKEHVLHRFTLRLWSWRDDFGNESDWAVRLGRMIAAKGADDLWPLVASR